MGTSSAATRSRIPSKPAESLALPDGSTAVLHGEALEIRDREGRLMVRYADGCAEISAPSGDLRLAAPAGRVIIQSALDVSVEAGRDLLHRAGRTVAISAARAEGEGPQIRLDHDRTAIKTPELAVEARTASAVLGQAALVAHSLAATADRMAVTTGDYELVAGRIVERARDSLREIADLAEERAGRVRSLVRGVYALATRRTVMKSSDDTSIDGSRILLG